MRQNLLIVLLAVCATLLAVDLLRDGGNVPAASGQAAQSGSGNVVISAANTQNEIYLWVYDVAGKKLGAYSAKNSGIELKGVRSLIYDFDSELNEYPQGRGPTAVANMKATIEKMRQGR